MPSRLVATIAAGGLIILGLAVGLPGHAGAFSEPIPIKISLLKWGGNPPEGKLYKIVSKPRPESQPTGLFSLPDASSSDPVTNGGTLKVEVGEGGPNGTLECSLLGGAFDGTRGWKGLGSPAGSKGYKYVNKLAPGSDPCKIAIVKEKVIKVLAKRVGGIDPPLPSGNPDVFMFITAGTDEYCAVALATHSKEKANSLIKMKDQPAPATCQRCGDDAVNLPGEECDGTDDSACPGYCIPRGGGGGICGDNLRNVGADCTCASEECDGTDSPVCPGFCLANCTCPEPVCSNGVKETGEECDPAGSTADCPVGEICGGFCTCVPEAPCDCGSPDPTLYMFTGKAPVQPSCGTTDGGPPIDNLQCGGLYIGGGSGGLPVPNMMPDEYVSTWNVAQCKGKDLTLTHTTQAQAGTRHCTEGKKCVGGTNDGEPCVRDHECNGGSCETRCFFGSPISVLDVSLPTLSTCAINEIAGNSSGGADCSTGESLIRYPIDTTLYLTSADQSASTPGHNPCPICVGGTLNVPNSGHCEGGPNGSRCTPCPGCPFIQCGDDSDCPPPRTCDIRPCMPQSTPYDLHDCCAGGGNYSKPCSDNSDCPSSTCVPGCSIYPTSHDCPPHPLAKVGGIIFSLDLTADTSAKTADANGNFCGWCRDVDAEGSQCFEGDSDTGGAKLCPDSSVIACRPATYNSPPPLGGNTADLAECGDPLPCRTDADCTAPYETCDQRDPGAWRDATTRNMTLIGTRPGDLTDHLAHPGILVSAFCIPPTLDSVIDNQANLGGPGGLSLEIEMELSPSGAFIDLTSELLH